VNLLEIGSKIMEARNEAQIAQDQFSPEWLMRSIFAMGKKAMLEALANDPKIEILAKRLSVDEKTASVIWDAMLTHLREDF